MIVRCVLLVAAMVALAASAVIVTASTPSASDTRDAPVLRLECRSRGPPEHRCDSPGRRFQFPSCPLDPHCLEHRNTRRPGSHLPNILDPRITTDYNNQPNPNPRRALPDQITANSVDRRTRESLIVHICDALDSLEEQSHLPDEIVVVVDHNQPLLERIATRFAEVRAVASDAALRGPGGIRNTA